MRLFICFFFCLASTVAFSQDYIDLAKLYHERSAQNQFDTSTQKTDISEFGLSLTLPIVLSKKTAFITGGAIDRFTMDFVPGGPKSTISSYLLKAGLNIKHSDKVSGTYLLLPKLASDFESDLNSSDFQLGAVALLKFKKRENFLYKLGLYYNPDQFGTFFVPLLGLYSKTEKWEFDMSLPVYARANYNLGKNWTTGFDFKAVVKSFNLHQSYLGGTDQYVHQATNEISAVLAHEFKPGIILKGQVGYTIGRSYRVYNDNDQIDFGISAFRFGDDRQPLNPDFADGLVFRAELIYRFHLEEK